MINFIIYEDNKKWQELYKNSILKIIGCTNIKYNFLTFNQYDENIKTQIKNLVGQKIYLVDIKVPGKSGIDFAREIRSLGDWQSPIIAITSHTEYKNNGFTSKTLMLDFIIKDKHVLKQINENIKYILNYIEKQSSFNFTYKNEFYQIPFEDIYYFEKDLNNNNTKVITKRKTYIIRKSITQLTNDLKINNHFFKSHQSFIINLKNIEQVDFNNNLIYLKNQKTCLLSRNKKTALKKRLQEYTYEQI